MKTLNIDLETFSSADLAKSGVFRYAEAPDFEILLFGYSVDSSPVQVIDLASGESLPTGILEALTDENVIKYAHNAQFERICLSRYLGMPTGQYFDPQSWRCTMVWAAYLGLPLSLEGAALVTGADKKKLSEGKDLIRYFCSPCKPTQANGGRTRNLPEHAPDKWERFKEYNARDVETEMAVADRLSKFPVPEGEWENYFLDQEINDRGVRLDMEMVRQAISCDARSRAELTKAMREVTDLDNPNSVAQMKIWLAENGLETEKLNKAAVKELLKTAPESLGQVLELRQDLAKTSVKKYMAMENAVCSDGRARGLLQFYGANRTGRFAGRLIQVQNLPQNHLPDLEHARSLVRLGQFDTLDALYDSVPAMLSELIRTAFVPKPGCKFIVADFSAIEARVIAWLAGETWRNEVFASHGKIYEASASQMFRVPIEEITKGSPLRQKGKIAELALGYGGSVGALKAMGALEMGLAEEELQPLVAAWRKANLNITRLWWDVDRAAMTAVREKTTERTHGILFEYRSGFLFITLPSGRRLAYVKPRIGENRFGSECVTYEGVGSTKKWERIESYGPKLVENCIAGDTLVLTKRGWIAIKKIRTTDKVWDGEKWVAHDGLICNGSQMTITVDGVRMTSEHRILTESGWMNASSCQGHYRHEVWIPYGYGIRGFGRKKIFVARSLRLWKRTYSESERLLCKHLLRLPQKGANRFFECDTWPVEAPYLLGVEVDARQMPAFLTSGVEKLRRSWDQSVSGVERQFRGILERYGKRVSKRTNPGAYRRRRRLLQRELRMDYQKSTSSKQKEQPNRRFPTGKDDRSGIIGTERYRRHNATLPVVARSTKRAFATKTGCYEQVYDLKNCGNLHQFTVLGYRGAFIVHNCVQAISRDILCYAMQTLRHCDIVLHVHDEIVIEADPRMSLQAVCEQMSRTPPWAEGLLLRADGFECQFYKKD